ncbi:MAG TPA: mannonate dehydratase, partial [Candidatus Dorea intestinavium]|nr:mannonate dehydratase [Candidatus Dorea intestinavium]
MIMSFRWYGSKQDKISLKYIRQIPGMKGVITTLYEKMPGELWEYDEIMAMKKEVEDA